MITQIVAGQRQLTPLSVLHTPAARCGRINIGQARRVASEVSQ
ncbi:hypothetical protein ACWIG5_40760 [Streptomyces lydicus]